MKTLTRHLTTSGVLLAAVLLALAAPALAGPGHHRGPEQGAFECGGGGPGGEGPGAGASRHGQGRAGEEGFGDRAGGDGCGPPERPGRRDFEASDEDADDQPPDRPARRCRRGRGPRATASHAGGDEPQFGDRGENASEEAPAPVTGDDDPVTEGDRDAGDESRGPEGRPRGERCRTPRPAQGSPNRVLRFEADVDYLEDERLGVTIARMLNGPRRARADRDDGRPDLDAIVLIGKRTRVYDKDGARVGADALAGAESVRVHAKRLRPRSWLEDEEGERTPTFRAKRVVILG